MTTPAASLMNSDLITLGRKDRPTYQRKLAERQIPVPEEAPHQLVAKRQVLVVSFYTPDYAEAAQRLMGTLDSLDIPHDIVEVPKPSGDSKTAWYSAETDKATFLIKMLEKHPDYDTLVWLDADGEMIRFPFLFWNIPTSMGLHYRGFKEPISCTVAVKKESLPLLEMWAIESKIAFKAKKKCPSQKALKTVLDKTKAEWTQFPMAYSLMWRWNSRDTALKSGIFIHERWNRNAKEATKDKNGKRIVPRKSKGRAKMQAKKKPKKKSRRNRR